MKRKKLLPVMLLLVSLSAFFPLSTIAAPNPSAPLQEPKPECNPRAARLAEWMDVECSLLMDYQARGVGFGVIWQAYALSQAYSGLNWVDLVGRHMSEEGGAGATSSKRIAMPLCSP